MRGFPFPCPINPSARTITPTTLRGFPAAHTGPPTPGVSPLSDSPHGLTPPEDLSDEGLLAQCRVETFRAGGPGGQHQNTTDSAVRLIHLPSEIRVTSRVHRSQAQNKKEALRKLRERLAEARHKERPRIPTRVPAREKKARLEAKRRRSRKKRMRKPPEDDA
jgi:hypothetical protein